MAMYPENIRKALRKKMNNPTADVPQLGFLERIVKKELNPMQQDIYIKRFKEGLKLRIIADHYNVSHQYVSEVIQEQILPAILMYQSQFSSKNLDVLVPDFQKCDPGTIPIEHTCLSGFTVNVLKQGIITYDDGEKEIHPVLTLEDLLQVYYKNNKKVPYIKGIAKHRLLEVYKLIMLADK